MNGLTCRIKEYIQPFERQLALQELRALARGPVVPVDGDEATASTFSVTCASDSGALRSALAYWHSVGDGTHGITEQLRCETTLEFARHHAMGGCLPEIMRARLLARPPNKRCLRYATHGLHEYRGKFFPQLVRALMNIARLPRTAVVLDPMCGSGTTLVEARLSGRHGYGLDMNPLSVFITNVKCQALTLDPAALTNARDDLRDALAKPTAVRGAPGRCLILSRMDMREVMRQIFALLRPGGVLFLVVGNNRTIAGGQPVEIRTADHLGAIATGLGFRLTGDMAMDMLVSRDIFRKNAVPSERIIRLDKPQ